MRSTPVIGQAINKAMSTFSALLLLVSFASAQEKHVCRSLKEAREHPEKVTELDLSMRNLKELPPEIGKLKHLRRLDVSKNRLISLPPELGHLAKLEELDISFNQIRSLPPEIGNLTELKNINASFNQIASVPPEIGRLSHLKALNLSFNKIAALPPEMGDLGELNMLAVQLNPLTNIPDEMAKLENLAPSCRKSIFRCVKRNNPDFMVSEKERAIYKFQFAEENRADEQGEQETQDADERSEPSKRPELDLSFFNTAELKDMYRDAFNRKDYENVEIIQEELAARTKSNGTDTTMQYRGSGDPLKGLNISEAGKQLITGKYYALIIGIDNYRGEWKPLKNAVNDAKAVEAVLRAKYQIDYFTVLYNEQATAKNIIGALEWLVANVTENDNVFIYYSGHGTFKEELNKGFWIPVDSETRSTYGFISNSDIQTFLGGIKANHTLLASDACFSGDIFRGETISVPFEDTEKYYRKVHALASRQAITSGGVEPVMDGGKDGHSVFAYYFLKMLNNNKNKYYDASQLYNDIKIPVVNNSNQSPQFQSIKNTGDEGGQFMFIRAVKD